MRLIYSCKTKKHVIAILCCLLQQKYRLGRKRQPMHKTLTTRCLLVVFGSGCAVCIFFTCKNISQMLNTISLPSQYLLVCHTSKQMRLFVLSLKFLADTTLSCIYLRISNLSLKWLCIFKKFDMHCLRKLFRKHETIKNTFCRKL